jgi:hypothetical protein
MVKRVNFFLLITVCVLFVLVGTDHASADHKVGLWIAWNDLAKDTSFIDTIPYKKINLIELSFRFPIADGINGEHIASAIDRFHAHGAQVIAFVNMEFDASSYDKLARQIGDVVFNNPNYFTHALNPDGTDTMKRSAYLASWFDPHYKEYVANKIALFKNAGADYIVIGEIGYLSSEKHNFSTEALQQFKTDNNIPDLPTKLGSELNAYLIRHPDVRQKWFMWKYTNFLFPWLQSIGVDNVVRYTKKVNNITYTAPAYPQSTINVLCPQDFPAAGFMAYDKPDQATYDNAQMTMNTLKVQGLMNLGQIQFAAGNTGLLTPYAEDITKRANFLLQHLDGFILYGSQYWKRTRKFYQYIPDMNQN